jgi:hypothetical protein
MMRILIYAVALSLVATASIHTDYASARTERFPHVDSTVQFPQSKWRIVRHTIRLDIPQESSALSQLSIDVPGGLTASNDISVSDQYGRKINTNVSVNGSKVTLTFPKSVAPGTLLDIDMNNVKISGVSNAWLYHVSAKLVGTDADTILGAAQFRVY